jgi:thymidylate kinase
MTSLKPRHTTIEIAGVDGAGKTTLTKMLANHLGFEGRKMDPFSDDFHQRLTYLRENLGQRSVDAARSMALGQCLLREIAEQDGPRVYDRHLESARMWWSVMGLSPLPEEVLAVLPEPDLVLFLDIDPEVAAQRMLRSRMESDAVRQQFGARCIEYLRAAAVRRDWIVIDAAAPLGSVWQQALEAVESRMKPRVP